MFANFKTLLRMTKPLYVIAAVCLWIFSSCQFADYKYEAVYRNLPFDILNSVLKLANIPKHLIPIHVLIIS